MDSDETQRKRELDAHERKRLTEQSKERERQRRLNERELLNAINANREAIDKLAARLAVLEERGVYKYYTQSFKVFALQNAIEHGQELLDRLAAPGTGLNDWFLSIRAAALEHKFNLLDRTFDWDPMNEDWHTWTRPILEAFWRCSFFLRMLARFGSELDELLAPYRPRK